jgi:hypothetical protein
VPLSVLVLGTISTCSRHESRKNACQPSTAKFFDPGPVTASTTHTYLIDRGILDGQVGGLRHSLPVHRKQKNLKNATSTTFGVHERTTLVHACCPALRAGQVSLSEGQGKQKSVKRCYAFLGQETYTLRICIPCFEILDPNILLSANTRSSAWDQRP